MVADIRPWSQIVGDGLLRNMICDGHRQNSKMQTRFEIFEQLLITHKNHIQMRKTCMLQLARLFCTNLKFYPWFSLKYFSTKNNKASELWDLLTVFRACCPHSLEWGIGANYIILQRFSENLWDIRGLQEGLFRMVQTFKLTKDSEANWSTWKFKTSLRHRPKDTFSNIFCLIGKKVIFSVKRFGFVLKNF